MIIKSLNIDRFGILAGQEVSELSPQLNIFLGDNEAGKSTLLAFFRAMFFGYQRSGRNALDYLAAGASTVLSGGSLKFENSQGTQFTLTRRPGRRGGLLTLNDAAGRELPEKFLLDLLSDYTDKMYDQVFCFGHAELSSLSGMKEPQVAGVLHAAAFGTGFKSPWDVSKSLLDSQKNIFSPRAYTTPVNKCFKRLAEIQSELARVGSELSLYNGLKTERELIEKEQEELRAELLSLSFELSRQQSLLGAWSDWSALGETRSALVLSPHPGGDFAVESLERFDEIVLAIDERRAGLNKKLASLSAGREAMRQAETFAPLNAVWPECQALLSRKESLQKAMQALPRRKGALTEAKDRLSGLVQGLGRDWTVEQARNFEISLVLQNGVDLGRQRLEAAERSLEQARLESRRLTDEAREAAEAVMALRHSLGQSVASALEAENSEVSLALYSQEARVRLDECGRSKNASAAVERAAANRLAEFESEISATAAEISRLAKLYEKSKAEVETASAAALALRKAPLFSLSTARKDSRRVPWLVLCLLIALLCFSGTYHYFDVTSLGQDSWAKFTSLEAWKIYLSGNWLSFGLGLAFLWGAFYWLSPRTATLGLWHPKESAEQLVSAEEREAQSRAEALAGQILAQKTQAERLEKQRDEAFAIMQEAAGAAEAASNAWTRQTDLYSLEASCPVDAALRIFDFSFSAAQAAKKSRSGAELLQAANAKLLAVENSWREWLQGQGLNPDYTPETVRLAIQRIQQIKELAAQIASDEAELETSKNEIASFEQELASLCARAAFTTAGDGLVAHFESLYKASFAAHESTLRLEEQSRELQSLEVEISSQKELLQKEEQRLARLFSLGEAADEDDYRLRFKQQAAYISIRRDEERILSRLEQNSAQLHSLSGQALWANQDEFLQALGKNSRMALEEQVRILKDSLAALESAIAEKQSRQGEIKALLEGLESGKGSAELQQDESAVKDELKKLAREWGVLSLARTFISQARRSFEEERHGNVICQAGEVLSSLTGARYQQMQFDLASKDFKAYAISGSGENLDSENALSQGTKEQLYLALRLAFIKQHNLAKESLPLIMDDTLVNFDPRRTKNAAKLFASFSAANQIMFFTCHPHAAKVLREAAPTSKTFTISSGRISSLD